MKRLALLGVVVVGFGLFPSPLLGAAVTLRQPDSGANVPASSPVSFQWDVYPGATSYVVAVYPASGCTGTPVASNTGGANTWSTSLAAGSYKFKVTANPGAIVSECRPFWVDDFCSGPLLTGDFNGDGLTDRLCSAGGTTRVSLATPTGFAAPTQWLSQALAQPMVGDFNADGLSDIANYDPASFTFSVALSNGSPPFGALSSWGTANAG